jgi:hypothetical protein
MTGAVDDVRSWAAPPLADLLARPAATPGAAADATTSAAVTSPAVTSPAGSPDAVVAEVAAVRGGLGEFLAPTARRAAAASLLSYNRLRPARVRAARAGLAAAFRVGAGGLVSRRRTLRAPATHARLLAHLATVLDEPDLVFAGTEKGGSGFVTPVLQLFTPTGRCIGFAKIGWDPVTVGMIRTEADALARVAEVGLRSVGVPELAWRGPWLDLELVVTRPMPRSARRLPARDLPPVAPLLDVAALDGPVERRPVRSARYWTDAVTTAAAVATAGDRGLADQLERVDARFGAVDLPFGRWHGDWVEWNLARADGRVYAWDWAYSAPGVPVGFDLLQFFHLRHRYVRGATPPVALDLAARDARDGLAELGLDGEQRAAVTALHRIEVELREQRAAIARRTDPGAAPAPRRARPAPLPR